MPRSDLKSEPFRLPRRALHGWDVTPKEAVALQRRLASRVSAEKAVPLQEIRRVAGVDVSYEKSTRRCHAAIVVMDRRAMTVLEEVAVSEAARFPYVPGLLSFREIPPLLSALERVRSPIDAFLVDGQGYAHPRRIGLASHLGLWVKRPTVGCAKSLLIGEFKPPGPRRGSRSALMDPRTGERIGAALRTRDGVAPVFVSVGHLVDLDQAIRLVLGCARGFRLTEPIRFAHALSNRARRREAEGGGE